MIGIRTSHKFRGLFACPVLREPSCPVLIAEIRSTIDPSRDSPKIIRSGLCLNAAFTSVC